jgi:threonyl-tRNA synthetase
MIHRAIFGSLERFFGIMTENYAGDYPFWLAPEQIRLLPVTDEVQAYAESLQQQLTAAGVRATVDRSGDRLGKLIRTGEKMKIPVLAVIGAKEAEQGAANLRSRRDGDLGLIDAESLIRAAQEANNTRSAGLSL